MPETWQSNQLISILIRWIRTFDESSFWQKQEENVLLLSIPQNKENGSGFIWIYNDITLPINSVTKTHKNSLKTPLVIISPWDETWLSGFLICLLIAKRRKNFFIFESVLIRRGKKLEKINGEIFILKVEKSERRWWDYTGFSCFVC